MPNEIIREFRPANGAPATVFITSSASHPSLRNIDALRDQARQDFPAGDFESAAVRTRADAGSRGRLMLVLRVPTVTSCPPGYTPVSQSPRYVR